MRPTGGGTLSGGALNIRGYYQGGIRGHYEAYRGGTLSGGGGH